MPQPTPMSALDQAVLTTLEIAVQARNNLSAASAIRAQAEQAWLDANAEYLDAITHLHAADYAARQAFWTQQ